MEDKRTALEYDDPSVVDAYCVASSNELWHNTTFYSFTNYVKNALAPSTAAVNNDHKIFQNMSVLDLACGEGVYTRWAVTQGASKVVGIDISQLLIEKAKTHLAKETQNITFIAKDVLDIDEQDFAEQFDIVISIHLLCYANTPDKLFRMLKIISSCMKKGGRFFGVRECLDSSEKGPAPYKVKAEVKGGNGPIVSYELNLENNSPKDYCNCRYHFLNSDRSVYDFSVFPVRESTMIDMFLQTGFAVNSCGPRISCSPEGTKLFPKDFMDAFINDWGRLLWYYDTTKV